METKIIRDFIMNDQPLPWLSSSEVFTKKKSITKEEENSEKGKLKRGKKIKGGEISDLKSSNRTYGRVSNREPNQIILKAAEYVKDEFWKEIIIKMANYITPPKFSLGSGNVIAFRKNMTTIQNLQFNDTNIENLGERIISFIQEYTNLKSTKDKENERIIALNIKNNKKVITQWKEIKSHPVQLSMIYVYSNKQVKKYFSEITDKKILRTMTNNLYSSICTALTFKIIQSNDIIMENQKIKDITNVIFDEISRIFYIEVSESYNSNKELSCKRHKSNLNIFEKIIDKKPVSFNKLWSKTCNIIETRGNKKVKRDRDIKSETISIIESSQTE